jgi:glutamate-ammonia-ligase adenylyltransferase
VPGAAADPRWPRTALRERRLLVALDALVAAGQIAPEDGAALREAYLFLRRLENRLQMLRDAQTHVLPSDALDRERIAVGLGYPDWEVLRAALAEQQQRVSTEFAALLAPRKGQAAPDALANYWRSLPEGSNAPLLAKPVSSMPTAPTSRCAISPRAPA